MKHFDSIDDFCEAVSKVAPYVTNQVMNALGRKILMRYRSAQARARSYHEFGIPKKSGGERKITAPTGELKDILTCTAHLLTEIYSPHDCTMGFVHGRSVLTNASCHTNKSYVLNLDLKDFFTSVRAPKIEGALVKLGVEPMTAQLISTLCSFPMEIDGKIRNVLPQGSPASPILSNIACGVMDARLKGLADRFNLCYSRYADDITFSWSHHFWNSSASSEFWEELISIIGDNGFSVNPKKTRINNRGSRLEVTGLTVGEKVNVSRSYIKNLRTAIHQMEHGNPDAWQIRQVSGRLAYLGMVKGKEDPTYNKLRHRLRRIKYFYKKDKANETTNSY